MSLPYYDAEAVAAALPFERTMRAIEDALRTIVVDLRQREAEEQREHH